MDFANEGKEYGLDAGGNWTNTLASVDTNYDTHGTLTLASATLDGVDILSQVVTEDNVIFLYKASGLALGEHIIKVKATDAADLPETGMCTPCHLPSRLVDAPLSRNLGIFGHSCQAVAVLAQAL